VKGRRSGNGLDQVTAVRCGQVGSFLDLAPAAVTSVTSDEAELSELVNVGSRNRSSVSVWPQDRPCSRAFPTPKRANYRSADLLVKDPWRDIYRGKR